MASIRFSELGKKVILIDGFMLFCGALFLNLSMVVLSVVLAGFFLYQYRVLRRSLNELPGLVSFTPDKLEASFTAGAPLTVEVSVESEFEGSVKVEFPYGKFDGETIYSGTRLVNYMFRPVLAANYMFDEVKASLVSGYGLLEGSTSLPYSVSLSVYPRVVSAALDALSFLEGQGIQGAGEQISVLKGRGYEYADSREYVPGDSLKMVNWKASARLNKLIVKEYFMEGSGAIHILYENMVSDPVSSDVLSACFLRTVQSFAERSWLIGLTIIEKGKVSTHLDQLHPDRAVATALQYVLRNDQGVFRQLYEVLDPVYRPHLGKVLGEVVDEADYEMKVIKDELFRSSFGGLVYITSLIDDPVNLLEISYMARLSGTRMVVLEPCMPWVYSSLEESYRIWRHYDKLNRSLARSGVGVAVSVDEVQDKLGERAQAVWI